MHKIKVGSITKLELTGTVTAVGGVEGNEEPTHVQLSTELGVLNNVPVEGLKFNKPTAPEKKED